MKMIKFDMADVSRRLEQPAKSRRVDSVERWIDRAFSQGWLTGCDVEDLIADYDDRLWQFKFRDFADSCGIGEVTFYPRPRTGEKEVWGAGRFDVSRVAVLLIQLERLGFDVDAVEWVNRLRPKVMKKDFLEGHELAIFWYPQERGKYPPLYAVPRPMIGHSYSYDQTSTGYHLIRWFDREGQLLNLEVAPPKTKGMKARLKMETNLHAHRSQATGHPAE